jgi:hypothetical protein
VCGESVVDNSASQEAAQLNIGHFAFSSIKTQGGIRSFAVRRISFLLILFGVLDLFNKRRQSHHEIINAIAFFGTHPHESSVWHDVPQLLFQLVPRPPDFQTLFPIVTAKVFLEGINLVDNDDLRHGRQLTGPVFHDFFVEHFVIGDGIVGCGINQMHNHVTAFNVPQKRVSQTYTASGSRDQTWNIAQDQTIAASALVELRVFILVIRRRRDPYTEIGDNGSERIVCNFRLCSVVCVIAERKRIVRAPSKKKMRKEIRVTW